jgi:hypothetical protein
MIDTLREWKLWHSTASTFNGLRRGRRVVNSTVLLALVLVVGLAVEAAAQGYGGPSTLSRGGNRPGRRGRAPLDFSFYAGVRGTAEQGLLAPALNEEGVLVARTAYGYSAEIGVFGAHSWRRSSFGVDYRGDYRYNDKYKYFNGFNQALSLDYEHRLNRRTTLVVRQTGGISNRAFGAFAAPAFSEITSYGLPLNELFDTKMYYLQSTGMLGYRKSARTTLIAQGDAFFVKRTAENLINSQGWAATGGVGHRLDARTSLTGTYGFMRFQYPRAFAGTDAHSVGIGIQRAWSRSWDVNATGGVYRLESFAPQTVQLSPEVAFILGRPTGTAELIRTLVRPLVNVGASYTQDRGRFSMGYSYGLGPGNGTYLTTARHTARAGYSYAGTKRASVGASAGYTRAESVALDLEGYDSYQAGVAFNYVLATSLNLTSQLDYRTFNSPGVQGREGFAAVVGLSYSPSRFPIPIW